MSPFKGQGANQALTDGVMICRYLQSSRIDAAVKVTQQQICQRTAPIVRASREAALYWHSPESIGGENHGFAGSSNPQKAVALLQAARISANSTLQLDRDVRAELDKHNLLALPVQSDDCREDDSLYAQAIQAARIGDLADLRRLSWNHGAHVLQNSGCIYQAAKCGHEKCFHWLETEAGCSIDAAKRPCI